MIEPSVTGSSRDLDPRARKTLGLDLNGRVELAAEAQQGTVPGNTEEDSEDE